MAKIDTVSRGIIPTAAGGAAAAVSFPYPDLQRFRLDLPRRLSAKSEMQIQYTGSTSAGFPGIYGNITLWKIG